MIQNILDLRQKNTAVFLNQLASFCLLVKLKNSLGDIGTLEAQMEDPGT